MSCACKNHHVFDAITIKPLKALTPRGHLSSQLFLFILLFDTATQCCLFKYDFQPWLRFLFLAWLSRTCNLRVNMCPPPSLR